MNAIRSNRLAILGAVAGLLSIGVALWADSPGAGTNSTKGNKLSASESKADENARVPVLVSRDRAKVMHDIYVATLDVMHHRYFHANRSVVPARAMEDVFSDIRRQSRADARWISVNLAPMSLDHEPKSEFEKRAAKELAEGKSEVEMVEDGYYRRAGAIPLTGGCISCHAGFFKDASNSPKYAGLVISIPVNADPAEPRLINRKVE